MSVGPVVPAETVRVRPGRDAVAWLLERIRAEQATDPLCEVTVLVSSPRTGLLLRRRLAETGYANVRFETLGALAERLARPHLAAAGLRVLTAPVDAALARVALRHGDGVLAAAADRPGLGESIGRLSREVRRRPAPAKVLEAVRRAGTEVSREAADAVARYDVTRARYRYVDEVDVLEAAAAADDGAVSPVIVLLPRRPDAPEQHLYEALATHRRVVIARADDRAIDVGRVEVLIGPDPEEEVRCAVRRLLAAAERSDGPTALHRSALVWAGGDVYPHLVRDCLHAAAVPMAGLRGRPLAETLPGRALRALVALPQQDFTRASVLAFVSGLPDGRGVLADQALWDRVSRDAGIVRGADQWRALLGRLEGAERARAEDTRDEDDARRERHRRAADEARLLLEHVDGLVTRCNLPARGSWAQYTESLSVLVDEFLSGREWSEADLENLQALREVIEGLGGAGEVEPEVDAATVVRTLDDVLVRRTRPEGRIGHGVLVGSLDDLRGLDLDLVVIVGCLEGVLPAGPPADPLVARDVLERVARLKDDEADAWRVALATAPEVVVCAPLVDTDGRPAYPSPWLLRLLAGSGAVPGAEAVRAGSLVHPRLTVLPGSDSGLRDAAAHLSLADLREAVALQHGGNLDATALAHDPDLPLARALLARRSRASEQVTEFDGNVAAAADETPVARGIAGVVQSATGLQAWPSCPFQHLLRSVLGVRATEDPDTGDRWWRMDPAARGSLYHRILERYHGERLGTPLTVVDEARLEEIAADEFESARAGGKTGHDLVWQGEREVLLGDLVQAVRYDAEHARDGWVPIGVEQGFGWEEDAASWPPVSIGLDGGREVQLHGYVDRVDRCGDGRHRVIDYKTSKALKAADIKDFGGGRHLQLPVYGAAVRAWQRSLGQDPTTTEAAYWYATTRGGFTQLPLAVDGALEEQLRRIVEAVDSRVRAGAFPQIPGVADDFYGTWENCRFCNFQTLCPASRDVLARRKSDDPTVRLHAELAELLGGDASSVATSDPDE